MKEISENRLFTYSFYFLLVVGIEFLISSISVGFLPLSGVEGKEVDAVDIKYQRYDVFKESGAQKSVQGDMDLTQSIDGFKLKAIINQPTGGIVIIEDEGKSNFLEKNEVYKGYELILIKNRYAVFEKNGEKYTVKLVSKWDALQESKFVQKRASDSFESSFAVEKKTIKEYIKNPKQIWKNISIAPYKKKGKILGYKVYKVVKGSVFDGLGLKKNDIITKANNVELKSNKDAINLYKKINVLKNVVLTIKRGDQEMELEYEIK